ncbi:MAG TPA: CRISPR system precrRNA processing endoribonuclease RAMP protein Cas6 [Roseiflexaceae bacterium]|nr:CRISPR system precrRNA processing endoribonuclease RAMP protein Cas6 [Roseiflexaceae bacterium]
MLPEPPALLRCRLTMRLLEDAPLPVQKGALIRGGFGYAFQRVSCPPPCSQRTAQCLVAALCPYRWVFETPRPPDAMQLHDLQDVPRPFVLTPPDDPRTRYPAGSTLDFELVLVGRTIQWLPFFLLAFERFAADGLGRDNARARLERVEALAPWSVTGPVVFQDGRVLAAQAALPILDGAVLQARAEALGPDVRLTLATPLRLKHGGRILDRLDLPALVQALCWRISTLAAFHSDVPWPVDFRALVDLAQATRVTPEPLRWEERSRVSQRGGEHTMPYGGLTGSAVLRGVAPELRALLLIGTFTHVGKACVFGNGALRLTPIR